MIRALSALVSLIVVLALLLPSMAGRAHACSCQAPNGDERFVREQLDYAEAIVVGEISDIHDSPQSAAYAVANVRVRQAYKSNGSKSITFQTQRSSEGCGYEDIAAPGEHLLALARAEDGSLRGSYCGSF